MEGEDRLNVAGLNAEASDLELLVSAAQELELPVAAPPGQVPGAVHLSAGRSIWIGHEALGAYSRPIQVTPRQARPGDVEFARYPNRNRLQAPIQHVHLRGPDRPANQPHARARQ